MRPVHSGLVALLGAATLALPVAETAAAASRAASKKKVVVTRKLAGQSIQADRWGAVQINVKVRLTRVHGSKRVTRKYVDLGGTYSYTSDRSQYIMSQALPMLRQEFLVAQSPHVQMISGATVTSEAFVQSLQSALLKLKT